MPMRFRRRPGRAFEGVEVLVMNALRKEKHISHFNLEEALEVIERVAPREAYLTHISHLLGKHRDVAPDLPRGVFLGEDGCEFPPHDPPAPHPVCGPHRPAALLDALSDCGRTGHPVVVERLPQEGGAGQPSAGLSREVRHERRRIARQFFTHLAEVIVESLKHFKADRAELAKRFHHVNPEVLAPYANQAPGVLMSCGHLRQLGTLCGDGRRRLAVAHHGGLQAPVQRVL